HPPRFLVSTLDPECILAARPMPPAHAFRRGRNAPLRRRATMTDLRYPIGEFDRGQEITPEKRQGWIEQIDALPARLRQATAGLTESQLDTAYRPGGWTVRQVVHHLADSHMNSYIRIKLAL